MSRTQTRRSISVTGACYDRLKAWCDEHGMSMSQVVEDETRKFLKMEPREGRLSRTPIYSGKEAKEVVVVTKELGPKTEWSAPLPPVVPGPVVTVAGDTGKKAGIPLADLDLAAKIFTF